MNMIRMKVAKILIGRYECARQTVSGTKDGTYTVYSSCDKNEKTPKSKQQTETL